MGLADRPYIGTWRLNGKELVQHTPDALVYINGDMSVPGCPKCNGRIDIQQFLTEVSVDAGTEPGSASSSFTLSIPLHHTDSFARDANFIMHPGLEVHVYMRGYFPVKGLYKHLAEPRVTNQLAGGTQAPEPGQVPELAGDTGEKVTLDGFLNYKRQGKPTLIIIHESGTNSRSGTESTLQMNGTGVHYMVAGDGVWKYYDHNKVVNHTPGKNNNNSSIGIEFVHGYHSKGDVVDAPWFDDGKYTIPSQGKLENLWGLTNHLAKQEGIPVKFGGVNGNTFSFAGGGGKSSSGVVSHNGQTGNHSDGTFPVLYMELRRRGLSADAAYAKAVAIVKAGVPKGGTVQLPAGGGGTAGQVTIKQAKAPHGTYPIKKLGKLQRRAMGLDESPETAADFEAHGDHEGGATTLETTPTVKKAAAGASLLDELGLPAEVADVMAYPYYHVFHGVVTEVGHSYSGGVNTITVNCSSMLHFWQYQNMSTNASVFGARPKNSGNKMSLIGHNFTGMHPYQIIYTLHHDMVGAAGGVGWALSQKTNQTATSEVGGESLYSLSIRYWERRFQGRVVKLRMHGATGELFSTMQAAWLGRTSSASLMSVIRNRYNTAKRETTLGIYEQAVSVGLFNKNRARALARQRGMDPDAPGAVLDSVVFAPSSKEASKNSPKFEINLVEMQAFVSNIGNWGQVNLFESSYESKLDIANKVCEVTGFEFYQDVDGDFVFKPPMYNLDTSASRVYRIEDIDIINIQFSEKEPQITYMTVKGSSAIQKNLEGLGTENEWGLRGQYIDYRLVAQFGWRPGSYETAYFNDPKSMFFSAVNRMDIMNVGTTTATVTIPIRPELRPGYPVYIPYVDAFYYCNSFAHSYSVGGQCTTTIQLVGKRAKFFAPGDPAQTGIAAINLGNTTMPPRPLEVLGLDGKPRLSGFPNVVMALDPTEVNPLFFVVGADFEDFDDPRTIHFLLKTGVSLGVLKEKKTPTEVLYTMTVPDSTNTTSYEVAFFFNESDFVDTDKKPPKEQTPTVEVIDGVKTVRVSAGNAGSVYQAFLKSRSKKQETAQTGLTKKQGEINTLLAEYNTKDNERRRDPKKEEALGKELAALSDKIAAKEKAYSDAVEDVNGTEKAEELEWQDATGKHQGVALLLLAHKMVGDKYRLTIGKGRFDLNSTINLLDMLSDKKATFTNGTLPGVYRYYSCSHPDPSQQGPKVLNYSTKSKLDHVGPLPIDPEDGALDPVDTYVPASRTIEPFPGLRPAEAGFEKQVPQTGVRVLNSNVNYPHGQVVPTSDILEFTFTPAGVKAGVDKTGAKQSRFTDPPSPEDIKRKALRALSSSKLGAPAPTTRIVDHFKPPFDALMLQVARALDRAMAHWPEWARQVISLDTPVADTFGVFLGDAQVLFSDTFGTYKYSGSTGTKTLGPSGAKWSITMFADQLAELLAGVFGSTFFSLNLKLYAQFPLKAVEFQKPVPSMADTNRYLSYFYSQVVSIFEAAASSKDRSTETVQADFESLAFSPVFPISDAQGYTVIGSYRYGRGVNIEPQGVFNQLHNIDPFSLLDKRTVDLVLRFFVQRKGSIKIPMKQETGPDGKMKWVPTDKGQLVEYNGATAAEFLNSEVIRQLKTANLTDKQILDYGLAVQSSQNPNQLDIQLANWFHDSRDGVSKLPVINAAYSLADLTGQTGGQHVCECKAAEAGVLIEAFGQQEFLSFAGAGVTAAHTGIGEDPADAGTRWVAAMAQQASVGWKVGQDALRGQVLDRGRSSIVSAFKEGGAVVEGFKQIDDKAKVQSDRIKALAEQVGQQASTIGEDE